MFFLTLFAVSALWYFHIWFQKHRPLTLGCFFFTYEIESCKVKGKSKFNFIFDIFLPSSFSSFFWSIWTFFRILFNLPFGFLAASLCSLFSAIAIDYKHIFKKSYYHLLRVNTLKLHAKSRNLVSL